MCCKTHRWSQGETQSNPQTLHVWYICYCFHRMWISVGHLSEGQGIEWLYRTKCVGLSSDQSFGLHWLNWPFPPLTHPGNRRRHRRNREVDPCAEDDVPELGRMFDGDVFALARRVAGGHRPPIYWVSQEITVKSMLWEGLKMHKRIFLLMLLRGSHSFIVL